MLWFSRASWILEEAHHFHVLIKPSLEWYMQIYRRLLRGFSYCFVAWYPQSRQVQLLQPEPIQRCFCYMQPFIPSQQLFGEPLGNTESAARIQKKQKVVIFDCLVTAGMAHDSSEYHRALEPARVDLNSSHFTLNSSRVVNQVVCFNAYGMTPARFQNVLWWKF